MDITGAWRAAIATEDARRAYPAPDFDDGAWTDLPVPGHWQTTEPFARSDGPVLARRRFEYAPPKRGNRVWLTFEGVFYQADVWLDGAYVGDTEGYFVPHEFDVTDAIAAGREHVVAVEVACEPQRGEGDRRNLTGAFQPANGAPPTWNPGGIWRPVVLRETGPVALRTVRVLCVEASADAAVVSFTALIDAPEGTDATVVTTVGIGTEHAETHRLAAGVNRAEWRVRVEAPPLWWPHALGAAELVDVTIAVRVNGEESDRRTMRTGLRQVRMRDWIVSVNGERLFVKGSNYPPARLAIAEAAADDFERDVVLAKEAGLDLLRVHAHISRPELYDAADRHGLLLWQDLPLRGGFSRGVRKQAARQAREAVDVLGYHPSIALWSAHDEPFAVESPAQRAPASVRGVLTMALPTWNKTVLDGTLQRALEKADRSRPVVAHSGVSTSSDSHLFFGWYYGQERDLPRFASAWPRAVRFVSAFGAQAVPDSDAFMDAGRWPALDWERLARDHGFEREWFARNGLDPGQFESYAGWKESTQAYQATVVRHQIETLRRLKYRPAGGFAQLSLTDAAPAVSWSVLDHERLPKRGFGALAAACAPVIVVAERPRSSYAPGETVRVDVHVVSDLREPLDAVTVVATVSWAGGEQTWRWTGDVAPDACARVGSVEAAVPDEPGHLTVDLALEGASGVKATNRYESAIRSL